MSAANGACSPRDAILDILRQRRGMAEDDTSDDADLRAMSARRAFEECCGWHLGDPRWADDILRWLKGSGYALTENAEHQARCKASPECSGSALDGGTK